MKYVAPELLQGRKPTVASDLYSVGVVAYELLRGFPPFASDAPSDDEMIERKLNEESVPLQVVVPHLHVEVARWIDQLLLRDPPRRYQTADRALESLGSRRSGVRAAWDKEGLLPVAVPTPLPVPKIPVSGFARYRTLIRTATLWPLVLRAVTRPFSLLVTVGISAAALRWAISGCSSSPRRIRSFVRIDLLRSERGLPRSRCGPRSSATSIRESRRPVRLTGVGRLLQAIRQLPFRGDPELPIDLGEVKLDRLRAQEECGGRLLVGRPIRHDPSDLKLLRREAV